MNKYNYLPIITPTTKQTFSDYIDSLDIPQIDYFAIGIQNTVIKRSISLMSLPEWQKHFVDNHYANFDPVRRISLYTKRNLIPFCEIDHLDNFGKEIMQQRKNMGIKDGIILMQRFPKFNFMITLGTGFSKFNAFDFIKRYHDSIFLVKRDLINLIGKDAKNFLSREVFDPFTHLSSDAK
ncbi:MAG: hypothetical protein EPO11_07745 [Gammaproteobacteria bacterium]|nr:MAG: hypothetical protein EPO11_07745 [Gammaproteobacteria bacterium]